MDVSPIADDVMVRDVKHSDDCLPTTAHLPQTRGHIYHKQEETAKEEEYNYGRFF